MSTPKALVTGGAGFIGSHLVENLINEGYELMVIDNLLSGKKENIQNIITENIHYGDIGSDEILDKVVSFNPDVCFHLAAQASVVISVEDPMLDFEHNILQPLKLIKTLLDTGCKKFVFSSSGGTIFVINYLGMPRSAPLVGGLVLALMTFPVVIIASRASLQSVPPSIRDAALGVGASKIQTIFDHILPLALPGILTGSIIGMARALGESAPLIMIGMVAFVVDIPSSPLDSSAALPVQVYLWADSPERGFVEKTSAAIMVLLAFLLLMNSLAIWLRNKYEIKW